jgi:hypothetical protein
MGLIETTYEEVPRAGHLHKVVGEDADNLRQILAHLTQQQEAPIVFPGPNPVSIDTSHFTSLQQQPYMLAYKHDGIRFCLLACHYKAVNVCVLFDRTVTPYIFEIQKCPTPLFQGTVFDGELCIDSQNGDRVFVVFDVAMACGIPVFKSSFKSRLSVAIPALSCYEYTPGHDTARIEIKQFVSSDQKHLLRNDPRFETDGIILMPENDAIVIGRHDRLFKLKTKHTVDFLVRDGKLYIYDEKNRRKKAVGIAVGPNAHLATEGAIVECELDPSNTGTKCDKWRVICVRTDKKSSNTKFVLDKTLLNIREGLSLQTLPFRAANEK